MYVGWDTLTCCSNPDIGNVVKNASETPEKVCCILSFCEGNPTIYDAIHVIKDAENRKELPQITSIPLFFTGSDCLEWMNGLCVNKFSLRNRDTFDRTSYIRPVSKQRIYRHKRDGNYWYFDFYHKDNKAHYEVFDGDGHHVGEADMGGVIIPNTQDASKSIKKLLH